jgi:hypothetical protein
MRPTDVDREESGCGDDCVGLRLGSLQNAAGRRDSDVLALTSALGWARFVFMAVRGRLSYTGR